MRPTNEPQIVCCPYEDCAQRFNLTDNTDRATTVTCPHCKRPLTPRPDTVWDVLHQREQAFRSGEADQIAKIEKSAAKTTGHWGTYRSLDTLAPLPEEARFDLQYEGGPDHAKPQGAAIDTLVAVIDDLRSQWNVGATFRTADGAGWRHIHLCGITPTPPAKGLLRVSLGAEQHLPWDYHARITDVLTKRRAEGYTLAALEQTADAIEVHQFDPPERLVLVIGNEVCGVSREALHMCEKRITIPMTGRKASLNVAVAFGIAAFTIKQRWLARHERVTSGETFNTQQS